MGDAKKLVEMWEELQVTMDPEKQKAIEDEAFRICAYNLWPITLVGGVPEPCVVKKGFKNVPERTTLAWAVFSPKHCNPEHFFMKA